MKFESKAYFEKVSFNSEKLFSDSELVKLAKSKKLTVAHVGCYLKNLEFLFKRNIETLYQAKDLYKATTFGELFESKWDEEKGHDEWARSDLARLNVDASVVSELLHFTDFLNSAMRNEPKNYFFYLFYAELMTSQVGPRWMGLMQESLGISAKDVTALSRHIELDGGHAEEMLDILLSFEWSSEELHSLDAFIESVHKYYSDLFNSIARLQYDTGYVETLSTAS